MNCVIGIDGGGTGCRAAIADPHGRLLGAGTSGPANIMTDIRKARDNIVEAARRALNAAGIDSAEISKLPALLGLAGAGVAGDFGERVAGMLPFSRSIVETDVLIALQGALGEGDGAVAIIGTGSVFAARSEGVIRRIGGWGFALGDLGSGARLGRALLEATLLAHDKVHQPCALTDEVFRRFGRRPAALIEYARSATPGQFGSFAPIVFEYAEQGDPVAVALVEGGLRSVEEALAAIVPPGCERLCMLGGLGPIYEKRLSDRYRRLVRRPLGDALQGALDLARRRFHLSSGAAAGGVGEES
jgi:glucosamine kinase